MCFLQCFLVFGRERKHRERLGRREISEKMSVLPVWGVPGVKIEVAAIIGPLAAFQ